MSEYSDHLELDVAWLALIGYDEAEEAAVVAEVRDDLDQTDDEALDCDLDGDEVRGVDEFMRSWLERSRD